MVKSVRIVPRPAHALLMTITNPLITEGNPDRYARRINHGRTHQLALPKCISDIGARDPAECFFRDASIAAVTGVCNGEGDGGVPRQACFLQASSL